MHSRSSEVLVLILRICWYVRAKAYFTIVNSTAKTNTRLQHVIRLLVSAQRAIIRPMTANHENQTPYILIRGKTLSFLRFLLEKYVCIAIIEFSFQVSVVMDMCLASVYNFNIRHPRWYVHAKVYFTLFSSIVKSNTKKGEFFLLS
jgi:hypothetical protein